MTQMVDTEKLQVLMEILSQWSGRHGENEKKTPYGILRTLHNSDSHGSKSTCPVLKNSTMPSVTLLVQSTIERIHTLVETCNRWTGPIVLVIYLSSGKEMAQIDSFRSSDYCSNITILPYVASSSTEKQLKYPINVLRNMGLDIVTTSHVLVADVDFIPSSNLDQMILSSLMSMTKILKNEMNENSLDAIVIPAFEQIDKKNCNTYEECNKYITNMPSTFEDLKLCYEEKKCAVFKSHVNLEGHQSTNSEQWLQRQWYDAPNESIKLSDSPNGDSNRNIRQIKCISSTRYEPFVVMPWCPISNGIENKYQVNKSLVHLPLSPYFDERFHGYGKNKIQEIVHLRAKGYRFFVLPEGFIIHRPHPTSDSKKIW
eukprot:CAMPEP_0184861532 /NCGR_PEP_ID=MMETSP0580-20130426/6198_1 /TAXON_ID=1118495 /ORGANISM="Dactyliosolen fragilissimus" /LENGTH=370 /DNA_ID=CAMNT_0027359063 /DNA_START=310 /DNA_END=1419 /DNA_ORIENTATION=-